MFLQQARALDFKSWQKWLDSVEGIDPQAEEEDNVGSLILLEHHSVDEAHAFTCGVARDVPTRIGK